MENAEERISKLENEIEELKKKLQDALRENDYLKVKFTHDSGAKTLIIENLKDENEKLVRMIEKMQSS